MPMVNVIDGSPNRRIDNRPESSGSRMTKITPANRGVLVLQINSFLISSMYSINLYTYMRNIDASEHIKHHLLIIETILEKLSGIDSALSKTDRDEKDEKLFLAIQKIQLAHQKQTELLKTLNTQP
jgi:hypothetical protein